MKKRQNICSFFQKNIPQIHAKTIHTLCFCMLMLTVLAVQGNGDPVALHSAITLSRTPVAMQIHEVQLVDEFVTFTPRDRYMEVNVRYLLHNHSDRSFEKLPYGFPIDYFGSGSAKWESLDDVSESQQETGWNTYPTITGNCVFNTTSHRPLTGATDMPTILPPPSTPQAYAFSTTNAGSVYRTAVQMAYKACPCSERVSYISMKHNTLT